MTKLKMDVEEFINRLKQHIDTLSFEKSALIGIISVAEGNMNPGDWDSLIKHMLKSDIDKIAGDELT